MADAARDAWQRQQRRKRIRRKLRRQEQLRRQNELRKRFGKDDEATPRQLALMGAIAEACRVSGYPPSMRELQEIVGVKSQSTILARLAVLEKKGLLTRLAGTARGLRLTDKGMSILLRNPLQRWQDQKDIESAQLSLVLEEEREREKQERRKERRERKERDEREQLRQCMLPGFCGAGAAA